MRSPYKSVNIKTMLSFANPWWLLAFLPALYLLFYFQRRSFVPARRSKQLFWFVLRSLLIMLVVFALAGAQLSSRVRKNQILFLVDASDSIAPEQKEKAVEFLNQAMRKIQPPDQAGIIVFGSQAEVERFPSLAHSIVRFESQINPSGTNLENALRLADAVLADDYQKDIVILSDGLENAGESLPLAKLMMEKDVALQGFYLHPSDVVEAQIEDVRVPPEIRLKEPFTLEVITKSNRKMSALLQILRNGVLLQEGTILLNPVEKNLIPIPQKILEPGIYRYDIRIKPQQDFQVENNSLQAWISVAGPPRILFVDNQPEEIQTLADAFARRGFSVEVKEARYFPRILPDMLLYQAILIRNVPASAIHSQMPSLEQYVHEFGGGFAMLGGKKSFGPGGYYQTPVENILPVRMDLVNKKYLADVAMVIVIDKSGSMTFTDRGRQKIDLADEGGARVASLLKETDRLGVLAVDSVPKWAFEFQKLGNKRDAIDAITSIRAGGGGIYVYSGLREAYDRLANVEASVKHVILFADTADCEEKDGASGDSSLLLAGRALEQHQITTTTIGIGQSGDPDVDFLEQLATIAAGRFYFTNDMFTLPQIFAQESAVVQRYYITEETFLPKIEQSEPLLSGVQEVPELDGYVATTAKGQATVSVLSHREDPVLAFWRHGLGHTLAYTSDPVGSWGAKWLAWPQWENFWAQTGRYLARSSEPARFQVSVKADGNATTVIVDTFEELQEQEGSSWRGAVVDSSGKEQELIFTRTSYGRFEAKIPITGSLFGKIFRLQSDQILEEAVVQFSSPGNREYQTSSEGKNLLIQMTGSLIESADQLKFNSKTATDVQPISMQLLLWAIWLFLLDVAVRKLDFSLFRRRRTLQPATVLVQAPIEKLKTRKKEVQKQRPVWMEVEKEPEPTQPESRMKPESQQSSDYMERLKKVKKKTKG